MFSFATIKGIDRSLETNPLLSYESSPSRIEFWRLISRHINGLITSTPAFFWWFGKKWELFLHVINQVSTNPGSIGPWNLRKRRYTYFFLLSTFEEWICEFVCLLLLCFSFVCVLVMDENRKLSGKFQLGNEVVVHQKWKLITIEQQTHLALWFQPRVSHEFWLFFWVTIYSRIEHFLFCILMTRDWPEWPQEMTSRVMTTLGGRWEDHLINL